MNASESLYTGDGYLKRNPSYHLEDAAWKAALVWNMIRNNALAPKFISDIGCGAGGVIKELAKLAGPDLHFAGYEISPNAIAIAQADTPANANFYLGDYFKTGKTPSDLLLVIDVVEHVEDYLNFLRQLQTDHCPVIFHIPLDLSTRTIFKPHVLKQQRDSVGHIHYFTREMVWWSLQEAGFVIADWMYTKPVSDTAEHKDIFKKMKQSLRNLSFHIDQELSVKLWGNYSVLVLAK